MSVRAKRKPAVALPGPGETVDFPTFLAIYNAIEDQTTPDLHWRIAVWLESTAGHSHRLLQAFRHAAKSHLVALYVAWRLSIDANATFIVISSTQKLANRNASFIRKVLETHPLTQHLVPQGETELWQRQTFTVVRSSVKLDATVTALALNGDFTGAHADELISDDAESSANSQTAESRMYVRERIQEFSALAKKITYIGTPHAGSESIYLPMVGDIECSHVEFPIYVEDDDGNRTYTWPEKFGATEVERLRRGKTAAFFDSQYLLIPANMNAVGLPVEFLRPYSEALNRTEIGQLTGKRIYQIGTRELIDVLAAYDPSTALEGKDDSVLVVVGRDREDNTFLHRAVALPPTSPETGWLPQTDAIMAILSELGIGRLVVETNLAKTLPAELKMAANRARLKLRIDPVASHTTAKAIRIQQALESIIASGRFHVHESVLTHTPFRQQAADFPASVKNRSAKDDFLDACALGVAALRNLPVAFLSGSILLGGVAMAGTSFTVIKPGQSMQADTNRSRFQTRRWS